MSTKRKTCSSIQKSSPKLCQEKNLTGYARLVRDLVADIHSNIQRWNSLHLQGIIYLKSITREKRDESYSDTLQELCDELEVVCNALDIVVENLHLIQHQLKTIVILQENSDILFMTWPTTKFGKVAETIYKAYSKEVQSKRMILENIAHNHTDSWKMLHLATWEYQPFLPEEITMLLHLLFVETGHRAT